MRYLLVGLTLLAAACGGDGGSTEPEVPEVEGQWNGPIITNVGSGSLSLTLNEAGGTVTGTGTLSVTGDAVALTVTGNYAQPNVSLQMTSPGFEPLNLSGEVSEEEIDGTLNGSGFVNIAVTLTRQ
ncbi:MAG TPA: hypothetical protein VG500_20835 [Gemmatimonadales bacterium]|nr:hypothetical protein [Gemmatimonadales bacterium]